MKKLFLLLLLLILPAFSFAQTPGVATDIRFGSSLPSGAPLNSVFILTGGSQPTIYICNNSPSCTSAGQWINTQTVCLVNGDGGCAVSGTPSIDFWLGTVGSGTLLTKWVSNGTTFYFPVTVQNGSNSGVINLGCASDPGVGTSGIGLAGATGSCIAYNIYFPPSGQNGFLYGSVVGKEESLAWQGVDLDDSASEVSGTLGTDHGGTGSTTVGGALINLFITTTIKGTIPYWDGTQWNNFNGNVNNSSTGFFTETKQGAPTWSEFPVTVAQGGTGTSSLTQDTIYKGNTTSAMQPTSITENSSTNIVAIGDPLSLTTTTVPACSGCTFVPYAHLGPAVASGLTTGIQQLGGTTFTAAQINRLGALFELKGSYNVMPSGSNNQTLYYSVGPSVNANPVVFWSNTSSAAVAQVYLDLLCSVIQTGATGVITCIPANVNNNVGTGVPSLATINNVNLTVPFNINSAVQFSTSSGSNVGTQNFQYVLLLN